MTDSSRGAHPAPTSPVPAAGLTVLTPWYPSLGNRMLGNFVATWSALAAAHTQVRVVHSMEWPGGPEELVEQHRAPFTEVVRRMGAAGGLDSPGAFGTITRVPSLVVGGSSVPDRAEAAVASLRSALPDLDSPVMHGHVGYFGGLAAARLAGPDTRVIVTEHSSELGNVLSDERGRALYAEVLERAHRLTCVSSRVRDLILTHLPDYGEVIEVLPNPVDYDGVPRRERKPEQLTKWVFVGGLSDIKGVERLLEAFILFASTRPEATLDLFGSGPLEADLTARASDASLGDRVTFHGTVPRADVQRRLPSFDVLVGPSRLETFHLAVQEAIAAGLPVVLTRSGGPEEAIGASHPSCAQFVDVNDDAEELLAGVLALEARLDEVDLDRARRELSARLGPDAVAARLRELYGQGDAGGTASRVPSPAPEPERVVVFARRTWRAPMVEPQTALAERHGVETTTVGVPQHTPKAGPAKPLTLPQRALRKANRILSSVRKSTAPAAGEVAGSTQILLGDMTSAADVAAYWDANPGARAVTELDPVCFGEPPVDA